MANLSVLFCSSLSSVYGEHFLMFIFEYSEEYSMQSIAFSYCCEHAPCLVFIVEGFWDIEVESYFMEECRAFVYVNGKIPLSLLTPLCFILVCLDEEVGTSLTLRNLRKCLNGSYAYLELVARNNQNIRGYRVFSCLSCVIIVSV